MSWVRWDQLLPPRRVRLVPWGALEVLIVFLVMILIPDLCGRLFLSTGLGDAMYGPGVMNLVRSTEGGDEARMARMRVHLPIVLIALPFQLLAVPLLLRFGSGTQLYQLGLTTHRAGQNALLGVLGWVILAPCVLALYFALGTLLKYLDPKAVGEHEFEQLSRDGALMPIEFVMIVLVAMVAAPLKEELLFRGVLQRWLTQDERGSHAVMGLCVLLAFQATYDQWKVLHLRLLALMPVLFILLLLALYWRINVRQKSPVPAAIFASSLFFALVHSAWPSPVPLFVLALGLGWLAWRTQSLIGPMVLHSLFNGIASVQLLFTP